MHGGIFVVCMRNGFSFGLVVFCCLIEYLFCMSIPDNLDILKEDDSDGNAVLVFCVCVLSRVG